MSPKSIAALALLAAIPAFASDYTSYCNDRYGFCVDYPSGFGMGPASTNDDGRKFYDEEGFQMTASGINNVLDSTVASEMKGQEKDFDTVTYRKRKDDWYALSGYKDGNILYVKSWVGSGSINTLHLRYPTAKKSDYDAAVNHIVQSFRPGDLEEAH
ncbi:hypothetical protein VSS37_02115 [Candidatus Thiothrix sp. Deng01]|uniref:Uncharacterized protein n=1 Tax=Candidatus Thiothrix phosphatis TaxID=3112415 RepID=A0ABU6CSF0_9GAMM|nr:hypothetical protein [Candidatus Thiothrix sp. Deng01]MEB4589766.1 hypothetical protein [Candidatus Thiothrix sp. Deng01]